MKGMLKTVKRTPHMLTSKVGMSAKSSDAETDELVRKFTGLEGYTDKLVKDTTTFKDAVLTMLTSEANFGDAFTTLFQPMGSEASLSSTHPSAATTLRHIAGYQEVMAELRDNIQPELEILQSRVVAPLKEYQDLLKKIRKTITKREHKLVDYDRFNNSYKKLQDKKEKSLKDEQNMFKLEQDLDIATQDYEHFNNLLKSEIPHFLKLTSAFIAPVFQTFYFVKVGILYTLLERLQAFSAQAFGGYSLDGLEAMHYERLGDTIERLEALTITKRYMGSARLMAGRQNSTSSGGSTSRYAASTHSTVAGARKTSVLDRPPTVRNNSASYGAAAGDAPPPPYTGTAAAPSSSLAAGAATGAKRPPPPPPGAKPRPAATYVTALYDFAAQAAGDLSFRAGDKIELVKRTESSEDWWTGRLNGVEGQFPANYVQL